MANPLVADYEVAEPLLADILHTNSSALPRFSGS
jgi:alpha-galactosidase/6-phospho-beta-glucosidase family protein